MNVLILCLFSLVPFHNASVHEAKLTVCPDFAEVLRFENTLESFQIPDQPKSPESESVLTPTPEQETAPEQTFTSETDPEQTFTSETDPEQTFTSETDPEQTFTSETDPAPALTPKTDQESILTPEPMPEPIPLSQLEPEIVPENPIELKQPVVEPENPSEPAPLEIPERLTLKPLSPSQNVEFAAAEEPVSEVQPVPAGSRMQETVTTDAPIRRPWGVLMFFIFLLLLSVSANVFLGWQLVETRLAKLR